MGVRRAGVEDAAAKSLASMCGGGRVAYAGGGGAGPAPDRHGDRRAACSRLPRGDPWVFDDNPRLPVLALPSSPRPRRSPRRESRPGSANRSSTSRRRAGCRHRNGGGPATRRSASLYTLRRHVVGARARLPAHRLAVGRRAVSRVLAVGGANIPRASRFLKDLTNLTNRLQKPDSA